MCGQRLAREPRCSASCDDFRACSNTPNYCDENMGARYEFEFEVQTLEIRRSIQAPSSRGNGVQGHQAEVLYVEMGPAGMLQRTCSGRKVVCSTDLPPKSNLRTTPGPSRIAHEEWVWTEPVESDGGFKLNSALSSRAGSNSKLVFTAALSSSLQVRILAGIMSSTQKDITLEVLGEARLRVRDDVMPAERSGGSITVAIVDDSRVNGTAVFSVRATPDTRNVYQCGAEADTSSTAPQRTVDIHPEHWTKLQGHTDSVLCCAVFPDGDRVITGSADKTAIIWAKNGDRITTLSGHDAAVVKCGVLPHGDRIITTGADQKGILWNSSGLKVAQETTLSGISMFAIFPAGDRIVTAGRENAAIISVSDGERVELRGHSQPISAVAVVPTNLQVLTVSHDGSGTIWSKNGDPSVVLRRHADCITCCSVFADNPFVLTGSRDSTAILWDAKCGKFGQVLQVLRGHSRAVVCCAVFSSCDRVVTGSEDATAIVWSMNGSPLATLAGHSHSLTSCHVSSNSPECIVTTSMDARAIMWTATGQLLMDLRQHQAPINSCETFPAGDNLVTVADDEIGIIWPLASVPCVCDEQPEPALLATASPTCLQQPHPNALL